uniref:DNA packaging tegument-like protein n=1 Tax=Abalone herpesvirus type 2 Taiwan/2007 TaxID=1636535 RepID=A0A0E3GLN6_9VIRU|nr:DNA packaging tegument-like protein [Abalone herpesvirus type 2 Taiwan/2007]
MCWKLDSLLISRLHKQCHAKSLCPLMKYILYYQ